MEKNTLSDILKENIFTNIDNTYILNLIPIGIGIYAKDGSMIYLNDKFLDVAGINSEHLKGKSLNILKNPGLAEEFKELFRQGEAASRLVCYNLQEVADNSYYIPTDNSIRYLKCNGSPLINEFGETENYIITIEDVTNKVKSEEELIDSQRKANIAMQAADVILWEFDVRTKQFYSSNEPISNYDNTQPISVERYMSVINPENLDIVKEVMGKMADGIDFSFCYDCRTRTDETYEWRHSCISGSPYERDESGRVTKYVGVEKNTNEIQRQKKLQDIILNSIPISIHIEDVDDDFKYVFCNNTCKNIFGANEGDSALDEIDPNDIEAIKKTNTEVFTSGETFKGSERIVKKNGQVVDTYVNKSVIEDDGKRLLLNVRWDQDIQNDLKRRAKLLNMSLKGTNAYTWFFEPEEDHLSIGDDFPVKDLIAYDLTTLDGFVGLLHPDDKDVFINSLKDIEEQNKEAWEIEFRLDVSRNGNYEWWETRGVSESKIVNGRCYRYMYGMTICIEAHKKVEMELRENKEKLDILLRQNELVLNNTNSGLAYIKHDYIVQWGNISIHSQGLSHESYKNGEYCYKSAHNRDTPCENCSMQRALKSHRTERIKFEREGGNIVEVSAIPIFMEDNSLDGVVIRVDNVTDRELTIERLEKAKRLAEESDKLKSKFIANMSHEIRTPLNAIIGFSELLASCDDDSKEEYLNIINNNNERLLKLVDSIFDLSILESKSVELKYEYFDLTIIISNIAALMKQRIEGANISIKTQHPKGVCQVKLDSSRVTQIITNYADNAVKYTDNGFIEIGYELRDGALYVYVKDSGIGIAKNKLETIFDHFEKVGEYTQGTGLGLSLCRAAANAMNGDVGVESTLGEGSLFWALIPCESNTTEQNR